jgi:hypothetical protein
VHRPWSSGWVSMLEATVNFFLLHLWTKKAIICWKNESPLPFQVPCTWASLFPAFLWQGRRSCPWQRMKQPRERGTILEYQLRSTLTEPNNQVKYFHHTLLQNPAFYRLGGKSFEATSNGIDEVWVCVPPCYSHTWQSNHLPVSPGDWGSPPSSHAFPFFIFLILSYLQHTLGHSFSLFSFSLIIF